MFTLGDNQYTLEQLKGFASKRGEDFDSYFTSLQQIGLQGEGYTPKIEGSKTAELPQISPDDVNLTEEQFMTRYKDVLGMMGFKVEQANRGLPVARGLKVGVPFTCLLYTSPSPRD